MRKLSLNGFHLAGILLVAVLCSALLTSVTIKALGEITITESNLVLTDGTNSMAANFNMSQNQITFGVFHKGSAAPANPVEGQWFYDTDDHAVYVYNSTDWSGMGGGDAGAQGEQGPAGQVDGVDYDYIIFVNSTSTYLLNGTTGAIDYYSGNDEYVFNYAIGNLSSTYGTIFVKSGTYDISDPLNFVSGVEMIGAGRYSTILNLDDGTDNLLVLNDDRDVRVSGFTVQCNTATFSGSLIKLIDACQNNRFDNMRVMRTSGSVGGVGLHLYIPTTGGGGGNGMFANSFSDFTFVDGYITQSDAQYLSCLVRLETHSGFINGNSFSDFWGFKQKFIHLWVAESDASASDIMYNHFDRCNYQADTDYSHQSIHLDCDVSSYNVTKNVFSNSYWADVASANDTVRCDSYTNYNLFFAIGGVYSAGFDDQGVNNEAIWSPSQMWGGDG